MQTSALRALVLLVLICLLTRPASAQQHEAASPAPAETNPLSSDTRSTYSGVKKILVGAAEMMPAEQYTFRPTALVRSYGEIVGHVADSQYAFCSIVLGEKNPGLKIEKTRTSKAELVSALREAFAYCDRAHAVMTDATATNLVKFMGSDKPKLGVLNTNNIHTIEHYGNLVTYLRMKNLVPPTSDPEFFKQLQKK